MSNSGKEEIGFLLCSKVAVFGSGMRLVQVPWDVELASLQQKKARKFVMPPSRGVGVPLPQLIWSPGQAVQGA